MGTLVEVRSNMQANCLMSRVTALMAVLAIWYVPEANSQESMRKWSPHRGFQENASTPVQSESPVWSNELIRRNCYGECRSPPGPMTEHLPRGNCARRELPRTTLA